MNWTELEDGGVRILCLSGEIDLQQSPKVRQILQAKVNEQAAALVVDFTEVKYIDSSGLATLVEYYQKSRSYSGRIALAGMSARVRSVFDLVRLSEIFQIYPTVAEAKAGLGSKA
jgi:anti-sigma B factor antagonist